MAWEEGALRVLNAQAQEWWTDVRSKTLDYLKAGVFVPLPTMGNVTAFHSSCELLYVREVFAGLFENLYEELNEVLGRLFHINGNSGVGKSAFLWYFIMRIGIEHPDEVIVYEAEACMWEFRGGEAEVKPKSDYPPLRVLAEEVSFHLIDQRVDTKRFIGVRAIVAASPDDNNTKAARKLRTTKTRYLPPWDKTEYNTLVLSWSNRVRSWPEGSGDRKVALKRLAAANTAYDWFGGIPRFLWVWDEDKLTEEDFSAEISRCLANTKLENVRAVLQERANPQSISWRLFHFQPKPEDLSTFHYKFCSEKVANLYAKYLVLENLEQLRTFIEASEPFPEYSALRDFVFEQYVIGQALQTKLMGMPMVDVVYCQKCKKEEDRMKTSTVTWIECSFCQQWYHMSCVGLRVNLNVGVKGEYRCPSCPGRQQQQIDISDRGLLLRYYDGDLEDALMSAGRDAVKYLWRSLKKNNAVFDFVLPPRTLGQITVANRHPSSIEALAKAMKALKAWSEEFDVDSKDKDVLLLYLLAPNRFPSFGFQRYRQSGKVSQRAVAGVVQCKVAVPVNGTPYAGLNLKPSNMPEEKLDLDANLETWEKTLACKPDDTWTETEFVSLAEERDRFMLQGCVYCSDELLCTDFGSFGYRQVQALCKQLGLRATGTHAQLVSSLEDYVTKKAGEETGVDDMDVE